MPDDVAITRYSSMGDGEGQDNSRQGFFGCVMRNAAGEEVATFKTASFSPTRGAGRSKPTEIAFSGSSRSVEWAFA